MKLTTFRSLTACVLATGISLTVGISAQAASEESLSQFEEALQLIRTHLVGAKEKNFDEKALRGLVEQLSPSVQLVNEDSSKASSDKAAPLPAELCSSQLFDSHYLGLKLGKIAADTPQTLFKEYQKTAQTNEIKGVVLDLRNSAGEDYQAAAALLSFFVPQSPAQDKTLFTLNSEVYSLSTSPEESKALSLLPRVILVNQRTSAAAEAIAGILRKEGKTLIIGTQTAGNTVCFNDFPLKNKQTLRIAVDTVRFPDGTWLTPDGIKPDISVALSEEDERAYLADPYTSRRAVFKADSTTNTNKTSVKINEAELVKMQNDTGREANTDTIQTPAEPEKPAIYDPVLARGIDILKTLPFFEKEK